MELLKYVSDNNEFLEVFASLPEFVVSGLQFRCLIHTCPVFVLLDDDINNLAYSKGKKPVSMVL